MKKLQQTALRPWHHQPSELDQIALFISWFCTCARRNLAACGTNQVIEKCRMQVVETMTAMCVGPHERNQRLVFASNFLSSGYYPSSFL